MRSRRARDEDDGDVCVEDYDMGGGMEGKGAEESSITTCANGRAVDPGDVSSGDTPVGNQLPDFPTETPPVPEDGYYSHESWVSDRDGDIDDEGPAHMQESCHELHKCDSIVDETNSIPDVISEADKSISDAEDDDNNLPPKLGDLYRHVGAKLGGKCIEGHAMKVRMIGKGKTKKYIPFRSLTEFLLFVFCVAHQLFRAAVRDLFFILRYVDGNRGDGAGEGATFDVNDILTDAEHFVSRLRHFLPLHEVWERSVSGRKGSGEKCRVKVYDVPITHILECLHKSPAVMEEIISNPGGAILGHEQAMENGLGSEHLFPVATRPKSNARRNHMHGRLASTMPLHGSDGFISSRGRRVYVSDMVMCDMRARLEDAPHQVLYPVVGLYFEELNEVVVVIPRFRNANEVLGLDHSHNNFKRHGLVRLWEEVGENAEETLKSFEQVMDLLEARTVEEMRAE